jgi:hypothetical protein
MRCPIIIPVLVVNDGTGPNPITFHHFIRELFKNKVFEQKYINFA